MEYQEISRGTLEGYWVRRLARRAAWGATPMGLGIGLAIVLANALLLGWWKPSGPLEGAERTVAMVAVLGPVLVGPVAAWLVTRSRWQRKLQGRQVLLGRITDWAPDLEDGALPVSRGALVRAVAVRYPCGGQLLTWRGRIRCPLVRADDGRGLRCPKVLLRLVWLAVRPNQPGDAVFVEFNDDPYVPADLPWTWPYRTMGECPWAAAVGDWHRRVREGFVQYLTEHRPDIEIVSCDDEALTCRVPVLGESVMHFGRLYRNVAEVGDAERQEVYAWWAAVLTEHTELLAGTLRFEDCADKILPRILAPGDAKGLLTTPLEGTGLLAGYLVKEEHSALPVTDHVATTLGVDADRIHARAVANLAALHKGLERSVRDVFRKHRLILVKRMDAEVAPCALLVPGWLREGEEIAVVIPDRDSLFLAPVPADGDWSQLRDLRASAGAEYLISSVPFRVTPHGFQAVQDPGQAPPAP